MYGNPPFLSVVANTIFLSNGLPYTVSTYIAFHLFVKILFTNTKIRNKYEIMHAWYRHLV